MPDPERTPRRLFVLLAVVVVLTVVTAGFAWGSYANPTPIAPPIVRVTGTAWAVLGCSVENTTGPGAVTAESSLVALNGTLENLDPSAGCTLASINVTTVGFVLSSSNLPVVLGPAGSPSATAIVRAILRAPAGWVTTGVALTVSGSP
jgi:hypothetical protein